MFLYFCFVDSNNQISVLAYFKQNSFRLRSVHKNLIKIQSNLLQISAKTMAKINDMLKDQSEPLIHCFSSSDRNPANLNGIQTFYLSLLVKGNVPKNKQKHNHKRKNTHFSNKKLISAEKKQPQSLRNRQRTGEYSSHKLQPQHLPIAFSGKQRSFRFGKRTGKGPNRSICNFQLSKEDFSQNSHNPLKPANGQIGKNKPPA